MKVSIENKTYNVEFTTLAVKPEFGRDRDTKILVQTDCEMRSPIDENEVLSRGSATQNYRDKLKWHNGRKHALAKALRATGFNKEKRHAFWNRYKEEYPIDSK